MLCTPADMLRVQYSGSLGAVFGGWPGGCCFAFHHSQPLECAHRRWQCCGWELVLLPFTSAALCSFCPGSLLLFCSNEITHKYKRKTLRSERHEDLFWCRWRRESPRVYTHANTNIMHVQISTDYLGQKGSFGISRYHFLAGWKKEKKNMFDWVFTHLYPSVMSVSTPSQTNVLLTSLMGLYDKHC